MSERPARRESRSENSEQSDDDDQEESNDRKTILRKMKRKHRRLRRELTKKKTQLTKITKQMTEKALVPPKTQENRVIIIMCALVAMLAISWQVYKPQAAEKPSFSYASFHITLTYYYVLAPCLLISTWLMGSLALQPQSALKYFNILMIVLVTALLTW